MRYVFILSPKERIDMLRDKLEDIKINLQIQWLKKRLPKMMVKANAAVAKEENAERKLAKLYTSQGSKKRQNGFLS